MPELHVSFYCKWAMFGDIKRVYFARAYKFVVPDKNKTPRGSFFVYSEKAQRYVDAYFYSMDWQGHQDHDLFIDRDIMRAALRRIGLDIR